MLFRALPTVRHGFAAIDVLRQVPTLALAAVFGLRAPWAGLIRRLCPARGFVPWYLLSYGNDQGTSRPFPANSEQFVRVY